MPVTPFHFGIGLLFKGISPERFSLLAFAASQVVIDLETAYSILANRWPLHRELHTFAVAAPVGVGVGVMFWLAGRFIVGLEVCWRVDLNLWPAVVGGAAGGMTHPLLDGVMHPDILPLSPFSADNPFFRAVGVMQLHLICVIAAIAGGLIWAARTRMHSPPASRGDRISGSLEIPFRQISRRRRGGVGGHHDTNN